MRKADQEREREQSKWLVLLPFSDLPTTSPDRREAEQRKRKKASAKKVAAEASRKTAEEKARSHQEQVQEKRSNVFAAARRNDTEAVKKGVWEDAVDAAGGEARKGSEDLVKNPPTDPKETLMHIAAKHGNLELVKWLDSHSATFLTKLPFLTNICESQALKPMNATGMACPPSMSPCRAAIWRLFATSSRPTRWAKMTMEASMILLNKHLISV